MLKIFQIFNNNTSSIIQSEDKKRTEKPIPPLTFSKFNINTSNLAPLGADTVSFGARKKQQPDDIKRVEFAIKDINSTKEKMLISPQRTISVLLANNIHKEAEADKKDLQNTLSKYMSSLKPSRGKCCDKEHPVWDMEFRTKSANSIREKASQKDIYTKFSVANIMHDIVGARILLGDGMEGGAEAVIKKLIEAVSDGKLKIIEVENHRPADKKFQYASETCLTKLADASEAKYGVDVNRIIVRNKTGYTAIHLLAGFPDGYTGEIQIIGHDVAQLKELEDIPYKFLQNKGIDEKYAKIAEILSPLKFISTDMDDPENKKIAKLRKEFSDYTEAAYKYQRAKAAVSKRKANLIPQFLTIKEFSRNSKRKIHLNEDMDFNKLYMLKTSADNNVKKSSN